MTIPAKKQQLLQEIGWFAVIASLLALLLGAAVVRLEASKTRSADLHADIEHKLELISRRSLSRADRDGLEATVAELAAWREAAASQPGRLSAISAAAESAGITLTSLRDLDDERAEDGKVVSYSHRLRGLGDYHQMGIFLDELYAAPGMLAVEDVEIAREKGATPGRIQISLRVTWFAPGIPEPTPDEANQ